MKAHLDNTNFRGRENIVFLRRKAANIDSHFYGGHFGSLYLFLAIWFIVGFFGYTQLDHVI
jgi:hypothetical protein